MNGTDVCGATFELPSGVRNEEFCRKLDIHRRDENESPYATCVKAVLEFPDFLACLTGTVLLNGEHYNHAVVVLNGGNGSIYDPVLLNRTELLDEPTFFARDCITAGRIIDWAGSVIGDREPDW